MPKRQKNTLYTRPSTNPHPSLSLSGSSAAAQQSRGIEDNPSVADSLRALRHEDARRTPLRPPPVASVHPSLRNLLDVPDTPQPRPRPGMRTAISSRVQRIPGPAAPPSWQLLASRHAPNIAGREHVGAHKDSARVSVHGQNFLPGARCPSGNSLLHTALKAMAEQWDWHIQNDHLHLASLPLNIREILLTYIATYAMNSILERSHATLRVLFPDEKELDAWDGPQILVKDSNEVMRLDLSRAIGTWLQKTSSLRKELIQAHAPQVSMGLDVETTSDNGHTGAMEPPDSWDDADPIQSVKSTQVSLSTSLKILQVPKFSNLLHLSLNLSASMACSTSVASWSSLLSMTSHLSTLQSLGLAHWPCPTLTPYAAAVSATIRNPLSLSLPRVPYGGTDMYTESDSSWREAAGILKRLSRHLYCLKWLDLTGCGAWFGALSWTDTQIMDDVLGSGAGVAETGPDWIGSWRNVEYLALRVGWTPPSSEDSGQGSASLRLSTDGQNSSSGSQNWLGSRLGSVAKIGAPHNSTNGLGLIKQDWDVEEERRKYLAKMELERFNVTQARAHEVARHLRALRESARGKWIEVEV